MPSKHTTTRVRKSKMHPLIEGNKGSVSANPPSRQPGSPRIEAASDVAPQPPATLVRSGEKDKNFFV